MCLENGVGLCVSCSMCHPMDPKEVSVWHLPDGAKQ